MLGGGKKGQSKKKKRGKKKKPPSLCPYLSRCVLHVAAKSRGAEAEPRNPTGFDDAPGKQRGTKVHCAMR